MTESDAIAFEPTDMLKNLGKLYTGKYEGIVLSFTIGLSLEWGMQNRPTFNCGQQVRGGEISPGPVPTAILQLES